MDAINRDTYEAIAVEFAETRAYIWQCVKSFLGRIQAGDEVLDIGCGNGKNMEYVRRMLGCKVQGVDTCLGFVDICRTKDLPVSLGDSRDLPFPTGRFDCVLCVAMFHHLLSQEDRDVAMRELLRVLRPGGVGLLTCWATEQPAGGKFRFVEGVNPVPWKGRRAEKTAVMRYYYVYSRAMFETYFRSFPEIVVEDIYWEVGNWILVFRKRCEPFSG
jgi:SAM-dependent methyltransferase